jgi:hypothetical protein
MCVCMYMYMNNEFRVMACCMHGTFNTVRIDPSLCALPTCTYVHISQSAPWGSATLCASPPPWHNIFSIILFLFTTLFTGMIGISLHVQWPLTSHSHGSYLKGKIGVFCYRSNSTLNFWMNLFLMIGRTRRTQSWTSSALHCQTPKVRRAPITAAHISLTPTQTGYNLIKCVYGNNWHLWAVDLFWW